MSSASSTIVDAVATVLRALAERSDGDRYLGAQEHDAVKTLRAWLAAPPLPVADGPAIDFMVTLRLGGLPRELAADRAQRILLRASGAGVAADRAAALALEAARQAVFELRVDAAPFVKWLKCRRARRHELDQPRPAQRTDP